MWVVLCAPSYVVVAGFAIENFIKNKIFKFTAQTFNPFNPLVEGSNPSWPTNYIKLKGLIVIILGDLYISNLTKVASRLDKILQIKEDEIVCNAAIQRFEFTL